MAGGNVQQGAQVQEQPQQGYGTQPQQMYQQAYPQQRAPTDFGEMLRKRILVILILVGVVIILIAKIIGLYAVTTDTARAAELIATVGAFMIAGCAVTWALGSKRTTDWHNLGLLLLAAWLLVYFGNF